MRDLPVVQASHRAYNRTRVLKIRRHNAFKVDRNAGIAVVGGSALNNDAVIAFENGPVFIPGGTRLGVGYGGLTLGGGTFGVNTSFTRNLVDAPQQDIGWYRFDDMGADAAFDLTGACGARSFARCCGNSGVAFEMFGKQHRCAD